jgi:hypothetical protein
MMAGIIGPIKPGLEMYDATLGIAIEFATEIHV